MLANVVTDGMANSNLMDFITGNQEGTFKAGIDGAFRLTIPELLGFSASAKSGSGQFGGVLGGRALSTVLIENFKKNGFMMVGQLVLIPIAFTVAKKLLRKPVLTPANKMLKMAGLNDVRVG